MTEQEKLFINKLEKDDLLILKSLVQGDVLEVSQYIRMLIEKDIPKSSIELAKDIPFTYLPVLGVDLRYYELLGYFESIYDYLTKNLVHKKQVRNLGLATIELFDYATNFLVEHLDREIAFCRKNNKVIVSGIQLLDMNIVKKENLIVEQLPEIYDFLSKYDNYGYIFCTQSKNQQTLQNLLSGSYAPNQRKLVKILARYSDLSDLKNGDIKSFEKFVRK